MNRVVQDIPIMVDPSLSWEEIKDLANEIIQTWAWEGKGLGRIEIISVGQLIHVFTYEKPSITIFSTKTISGGLTPCHDSIG